MGLRSPAVLDQAGMSVGSQFGATGTPMAVQIDEEGNIASSPPKKGDGRNQRGHRSNSSSEAGPSGMAYPCSIG
jgi:hypothetical protein